MYKIILPALIVALHAYTGWAWILTALTAMNVLLLALLIIGIAILRVTKDTKPFPTTKLADTLGSTLYLVYFTYIGNYVLLGLLIATLLGVVILEAICTKK